MTQPHCNPDLALCNFWLFPKLKSPLKGKRFQTISEIQESMTGQLMMIGRTVRSQSAYFEGDWGIIVLCTMFLISCIFFNKCLYFSYHVAGYLLDRPCVSYKAGNRHWPYAVFWINWIVLAKECSRLMQNSMQIRCSISSVIFNAMATQYTCSLNGNYHPHWLVQWSHHCSCMRIPVPSSWLAGYIDVAQTFLVMQV